MGERYVRAFKEVNMGRGMYDAHVNMVELAPGGTTEMVTLALSHTCPSIVHTSYSQTTCPMKVGSEGGE